MSEVKNKQKQFERFAAKAYEIKRATAPGGGDLVQRTKENLGKVNLPPPKLSRSTESKDQETRRLADEQKLAREQQMASELRRRDENEEKKEVVLEQRDEKAEKEEIVLERDEKAKKEELSLAKIMALRRIGVHGKDDWDSDDDNAPKIPLVNMAVLGSILGRSDPVPKDAKNQDSKADEPATPRSAVKQVTVQVPVSEAKRAKSNMIEQMLAARQTKPPPPDVKLHPSVTQPVILNQLAETDGKGEAEYPAQAQAYSAPPPQAPPMFEQPRSLELETAVSQLADQKKTLLDEINQLNGTVASQAGTIAQNQQTLVQLASQTRNAEREFSDLWSRLEEKKLALAENGQHVTKILDQQKLQTHVDVTDEPMSLLEVERFEIMEDIRNLTRDRNALAQTTKNMQSNMQTLSRNLIDQSATNQELAELSKTFQDLSSGLLNLARIHEKQSETFPDSQTHHEFIKAIVDEFESPGGSPHQDTVYASQILRHARV